MRICIASDANPDTVGLIRIHIECLIRIFTGFDMPLVFGIKDLICL
jgi:hypothetical protein